MSRTLAITLPRPGRLRLTRKALIAAVAVVAPAAGAAALAQAEAPVPPTVSAAIEGDRLVLRGTAAPEQVTLGFRDTEVLIDGVVAGVGCTESPGTPGQVTCARSEFVSVEVYLVGGADNLFVNGAAPNGTYRTGAGDDEIRAFARGNFYGEEGNDLVTLAGGPLDSVDGGVGTDRLELETARDWRLTIDRTNVRDDRAVGSTPGIVRPTFERIVGGDGDDVIDLRKSRGRVAIEGGAGDDSLRGWAGSDVFIGGEVGDDEYSGGRGKDTLDLSQLNAGVTITLDGKANDGRGGERDNARSDIETLIGTPFNDTLRANAGKPARLRGLAGADRLFGGRSADVIDGGAGNDQVDVRGDLARDTVTCGARKDTVRADARDRLIGCR